MELNTDSIRNTENPTTLPPVLSVKDVAVYLGISRSTAYKLVQQSGFPSKKVPNVRRIVIPREQFLAWLTDNEIECTVH